MVATAEFKTAPAALRRPSSLGQLRRGLPLVTAIRGFRRDVAVDYRDLERVILESLRKRGVLDRLARDAAEWRDAREMDRRREEKAKPKKPKPQPTGRGGTGLGDERSRALRQIFSRGALGFAAEVVADPVDAFEFTLRSTLDDNYVDLFDMGGRAARLSLGVSGAFDLRSPAIAETLQTRANLLAGPVSDDAFDRLLTILADEFYLNGENPLEVAKSLEEEFDWLSRGRAERIARTESLTVTEEAQWMTYSASGVEWKRWLTTLDGRERESHFDAHGQIKPIDEPFEVGISELMYPGDPDAPPEEICNCFPGHVRIEARVEAGLRTKYVGPMIEITTRAGRRLTVTPNHPVLTEAGFRPAASLRQGENLLCHGGIGEGAADLGIMHDKYHGPTPIEKIFDTLRTARNLTARKVTVNDLHGDGAYAHSEIEIVGTNCELGNRLDADCGKRDRERIFVGADHIERYGTSKRTGGEPFGKVMRATASLPGTGALALDSGTVTLEARPFEVLRFGSAAKIDASRFEPSTNGFARDTGLVAKLLQGSAGQVTLDQVIEIRDFDFSGHVYDLQSPLGWIVAEGVICSNCRCAHQAIVDESQVFNDRAVWNGNNDPDEFAKDREQDKRLLFSLFGPRALLEKEQDYVRDDIGQFAETEGGGGGTVTEDEPNPVLEAAHFQQSGRLFAVPVAARKAINDSEERIKVNGFETGIAVDEHGKVLLDKRGGESQVEFTADEVRAIDGASFTHNHPRERSFSYEDLAFAWRSNLSEMRIVTASNTRYRVQATGFRDGQYGWPHRDRIAAVRDPIITRLKPIYADMYSRGELTLEQANAELSHRSWQEAAPELGLAYERIPG